MATIIRLSFTPGFWRNIYGSLVLLRKLANDNCIIIKLYDDQISEKLVLYSQIYINGDILNMVKEGYQPGIAILNQYKKELKKLGYALYAPQVLLTALAEVLSFYAVWKNSEGIYEGVKSFIESILHLF